MAGCGCVGWLSVGLVVSGCVWLWLFVFVAGCGCLCLFVVGCVVVVGCGCLWFG